MTFALQSYATLVENTLALSQDAQFRRRSGGQPVFSYTRLAQRGIGGLNGTN